MSEPIQPKRGRGRPPNSTSGRPAVRIAVTLAPEVNDLVQKWIPPGIRSQICADALLAEARRRQKAAEG